jgi:hypothetical protein
MKHKFYPQCAKCGKRVCSPQIDVNASPLVEEAPPFCPMRTKSEVIKEAIAEYDKKEVKEFARLASLQEFECYEWIPSGLRTKIPRIEETYQFAKKMGY